MANNSIIEKYCYNNSTANCDIYGGLYQWNEMMQYTTTPGAQGICPATGWHLPTDAEWTILTTFLGGEGIAGGKMKTTGTIEAGTGLWYAPNTGATNESGFTALPGGYRSDNGDFDGLGYYAYFWSSTEINTILRVVPGLVLQWHRCLPLLRLQDITVLVFVAFRICQTYLLQFHPNHSLLMEQRTNR